MAGYAKVFSSIRKSSLWGADHKVLRVWIYMLTECDFDGVVEGSVPGVAHDCHLTADELRGVLDLLMAPDPDSRTPDNEGRRLASVPGGWKVLNYHIYRERGQGKEGSRAPYMRQYRSKKPEGEGHALPEGVTRDTAAAANAAANANQKETKEASSPTNPLALPSARGPWSPPPELLLRWKEAWPALDVPAELVRVQTYLQEHPRVRYQEARLAPWVEDWLGKEAAGKGRRSQARARPQVVPLQVGGRGAGRVNVHPPAKRGPTTWAEREAEIRELGAVLKMTPEDLEANVLEQKAEWDALHEEAMC